ncbi:MAG: hypothetical protein ACK55I_28910, partial [bacterium]
MARSPAVAPIIEDDSNWRASRTCRLEAPAARVRRRGRAPENNSDFLKELPNCCRMFRRLIMIEVPKCESGPGLEVE